MPSSHPALEPGVTIYRNSYGLLTMPSFCRRERSVVGGSAGPRLPLTRQAVASRHLEDMRPLDRLQGSKR